MRPVRGAGHGGVDAIRSWLRRGACRAAVATARAALTYGAFGETKAACHGLRSRCPRRSGRSGSGEKRVGTRRIGSRRPRLAESRPRPCHVGCTGQRRGPAASRERLRARPRDVPTVSRRTKCARMPSTSTAQRRHPRGDHQRPGELGGFGLSVLRSTTASPPWRKRLPRDGRRHRGVELGLARHRRVVDHPSESQRALVTGHRSTEEAVAAQIGLGEVLAAVAVTEPDFGSDVAGS